MTIDKQSKTKDQASPHYEVKVKLTSAEVLLLFMLIFNAKKILVEENEVVNQQTYLDIATKIRSQIPPVAWRAIKLGGDIAFGAWRKP